VSEETQKTVEEILAAINEGAEVSNADARVLADIIDQLDLAFRVQSTVNNVLTQTIPEMASSLAGSVLSRAGRTDTKIRRSVAKICDEHVVALLNMVTALAGNLLSFAEKEGDVTPADGQPATVPGSGNPSEQS